MKLLPYDAFTIHTQDPVSIVRNRLADQVEPPKLLRWSRSRNHAPYAGTVSDSGFEVYRIIHYRNSFLPKIRGRFESFSDRTAIHITMGLHPLVIVFLGCWFLTWYSISIPMALSGAMPYPIGWLFLGLPIVMAFVFWGAFWYEAKRSRRELMQIIQGEPYRNPP